MAPVAWNPPRRLDLPARLRERILREQFGVAELTGFGLDDHPQAQSAAGAIITTSAKMRRGEGDAAPASKPCAI